MKFKNYRNPYTNDNRIYSFKDLYDMPFGELIRNKQEVLGQYRVLGVPTEQELQGSENVVWVEAYKRDDGTEVRGHWRSKPNGGGVNDGVNNETSTGGAASVSNKQDTKVNEQEQTPVLEKEEQLYPKEIAGVKRGKPMSFEEAGSNNINPNYDDNKEDGYSKNCSICNVCFDARLEGLDVEALPFDEKNKVMVDLSYHPNNAYIDPITGKPPSVSVIKAKNAYECHEWLDSNIKQGEQYSLGFLFKEEKIGHILRVFKDNKNEIIIYDPQRSRTDSYTYLNKINFKSMRRQPIIFRTDDKQINYEVLKKVVKPH